MATITFAGICTFIDPAGGQNYSKLILPNSERGLQSTPSIPGHLAFINAKFEDLSADLNEWHRESITTLTEMFLFLKGRDVSFSVTPHGVPEQMAKLEKVTSICSDAQQVRDGYLDNPQRDKVSAIIHLKSGAMVVNDHLRARSSSITVPVGTEIITSPYGGGTDVRRARILRDEAHIIIANVEWIGYFFNIADPDDHHQRLHCQSFEPANPVASPAMTKKFVVSRRQPPASGEYAAAANLPVASLSGLPEPLRGRLAAKLKEALIYSPDFMGRLDTLGGGCSNTTYP